MLLESYQRSRHHSREHSAYFTFRMSVGSLSLCDTQLIPVLLEAKRVVGDGGSVAKSCPTLVTPWTVARRAPPSMGFSRQEYWAGLPFLPPGDLPNPGIELKSPALAGRFFTTESPGKPYLYA